MFFIADTITKTNVHRDSRILSSKVNENSSYFNCRKTFKQRIEI
ncbi:ferredoxin [Escherichia coli]|nr:ferredoxin [Escherichia coli]